MRPNCWREVNYLLLAPVTWPGVNEPLTTPRQSALYTHAESGVVKGSIKVKQSSIVSQAGRAARANLVPGLCIQAAMLAVVLAYYFWSPASRILDDVAGWKGRLGYLFSIGSAVLSGAVVPEAFRIVVFQDRKVQRDNAQDLLFTVPFWAFQGLCVDWLYRSQALWFGTATTLHVLTRKVLVDQLVYTPLYAAPFAVMCFEWRNRGYGLDVRDFFTAEFYQVRVLPTLVANWGVWIPVVCLVYSLPSLLQVPLFALALSFWSLMLEYLNRPGSPRPQTAAASPHRENVPAS